MLKTRRPLPWRSRALLREHVEAATAASARPARSDRFLVYGPDHIRILLIGSGLAVGYGVSTRAKALDGQVGGILARRTGRGVIVNNHAHGQLRLEDQVLYASVAGGFDLEDIIIWCPSYGEVPERPWSRPWVTQMRRFVELVPADRLLIISELPVPAGEGPVVEIAGPIIDRINAALRHAADGRPNTVVVPAPPVAVKPRGEPVYDAAYHEAAAEPIAAIALDFIRNRPARQEEADR